MERSIFSGRGNSESGAPECHDQQRVFRQQLDGARRREPEVLSVLYRQFLPGIFGYIAARVPERTTAEDLTSEVFLKMVEGIGQLRANDEAGFAAWLLQIARITIAGYYRKRERQPTFTSLEPADEEEFSDAYATISSDPAYTNPAQWAEARDEWSHVVTAINMLTEEQRVVLIGRLIQGYDIATVARMIGKKTNAVKALQFRALNRLQQILESQQRTEQAFEHSHIKQKGKAL